MGILLTRSTDVGHAPDGSGRTSASSSEERQNDVARLSLLPDSHVEGNAATLSSIGEPEALGKETGLVQAGPVRNRHAPLAWRPWVLLHHVGPRTTGDRHGHGGSGIDNRRELVPGDVSPSARVGRIPGRQATRLREIPRAESNVMWSDGRQSAGELRRFLRTGQELGVRRSADNSQELAGIRYAAEAMDQDEHENRRGSSAAPQTASVKSRCHMTMMARPRSGRGSAGLGPWRSPLG
jgi:hypothetical protein